MENPYKDILKFRKDNINDTVAQKELKKAFLKLYKEMQLQCISVKELCLKANVARTTFYAYYQNIDELLEEIENNLLDEVMSLKNIINTKEITEKEMEFFDELLLFIQKNKSVIFTLVVDKINIRFIEKWKFGMKYHIWEKYCTNKIYKNEKLILEMIASEIMSSYVFYLKYPNEIDFTGVKHLVTQTFKLLEC